MEHPEKMTVRDLKLFYGDFQALKGFGDVPIKPGKVGEVNPFEPFEE